MVLGITSNEYQGKVYYQAQVFNPDSKEAGSIGISNELASVLKPDPSKIIVFHGEYNDKFKNLNLKGVDNEL